MPRKAKKLMLNDGDCEYLRSLIKQRTIQTQIVVRAHILLDKSNGMGTRDIACQRPADLGYSQELWTLKNRHILNHAQDAGYPRLATVPLATVQKILQGSDVKPYRIKYYCGKRDPEFETKMHDVLL